MVGRVTENIDNAKKGKAISETKDEKMVKKNYSCSTKAKHHEKFHVKYDFFEKAIYFSWKKYFKVIFTVQLEH